jgi:predicted XRE-type DNA-binding protein
MSDWRDKPCKEWPHGLHIAGYGQRQYKGTTWLAHRAAWDERVGPIPNGLQVLHRCDNRPCHEITHLFLGTMADNMMDKVAKGRQARGEKVRNHKLTARQVEEIRSQYATGSFTQKALAARYGIDRSNVSRLVHRKQWGHV